MIWKWHNHVFVTTMLFGSVWDLNIKLKGYTNQRFILKCYTKVERKRKSKLLQCCLFKFLLFFYIFSEF